MTEPVDSEPNPTPGADGGANGTQPGGEEPAGRDISATIASIAEDISERVTVLVDKATPVVRDAAARASELVAKAGEAAGPAAHRAAVATESLGEKVAAKGRDIAADLRRSNQAGEPAADAGAEPASVAGGTATADSVPIAEPAPAPEVDPSEPPAS